MNQALKPLLQSQLDYMQAQDELNETIGAR
jgi:hypothetical protein